MRFDVVSLGDHLPDPNRRHYNQTQCDRYQTLVQMGLRAEELGFGGIWLGEHHASDYIVPAPQMILAAIAAGTRRIRLGSGVSLLPNSDPVRLAEEFAMLDLFSKGRAEIGFGSGITRAYLQAVRPEGRASDRHFGRESRLDPKVVDRSRGQLERQVQRADSRHAPSATNSFR